MIKTILVAFLCFTSLIAMAQNVSAKNVLEKAIDYHDPNGNWQSFNDKFTVEMTTPNSAKRTSHISINLPDEYFEVEATRDTVTTTYTLTKKKCAMYYNGMLLDSIAAKEKKMSCDRALLYKNYYTYLYGLPMKLNDPGTNLSDKVENKTFKGKDYLVLKVTYDEAVGSDVWYFYFDPITYAMEIYQFFKTDDNGNEKPDSGEYILLSEEAMVNDIKMPKVRAWYYNKGDKYLGTDSLIED
ncbi:DUF6503 family protein [uncultured Winogradskyella sp.]|uniref:DUF6503 family protein n=1 Tax=uncultured Winogradskyella sp. TaxID=395353 RepID=UPI0026347B49|nr:DUF6503 family protein [uncultured Winogradskyella sp.]